MTSHRSTAFGALLLLSLARPALAQQVSTQPTFDLLASAHAADSLRRLVVRQRAELAKAASAERARADTIARQRRELAALADVRIRRDTAKMTTPATIAPAPLPVTSPPPTPLPAPLSVSPPVVVPTPTAPAAHPAPSAPAIIGPPSLTGMLQLWMLGGDAGFRNTYRVRRAEVRASGVISPTVAWTVMLDMAKALTVASTTTSAGSTQTSVAQGSRVLQDAVVSLRLHPLARVDLGQQKIPSGIEGYQSSGSLITVERALFASDRARGGTFGDVRDVGMSVRGRVDSTLDYTVGVFNGSGESQNDVDANLAKAVVAHLAFRPIPVLLLGASASAAGGGAGDAPVRDRFGVEARAQLGAASLQSEAVTGHDGAIERHGMYTHVGWRVRPALDLHARFDAWDPDIAHEEDGASATERDYLGGFTWAAPGVKVQTDVVRRTYSAQLVPSRWQLMMNLQTNW